MNDNITGGPGTEGVELPPRIPEMVSTPDGDQFICDEPGCDRTFTTIAGVTMHKMRTHTDRNWSGKPKAKRSGGTTTVCTLCNKTITNARMASHLRRVHNATAPKSRTQARTAVYQPTARPMPVPSEFNPEYSRPDEYTGHQISDDTWEERAAVVQRATAKLMQIESATAGGLGLNMGAFEVADDVVVLRDKDGGFWMLRRLI